MTIIKGGSTKDIDITNEYVIVEVSDAEVESPTIHETMDPTRSSKDGNPKTNDQDAKNNKEEKLPSVQPSEEKPSIVEKPIAYQSSLRMTRTYKTTKHIENTTKDTTKATKSPPKRHSITDKDVTAILRFDTHHADGEEKTALIKICMQKGGMKCPGISRNGLSGGFNMDDELNKILLNTAWVDVKLGKVKLTF